MEKVVTGTAIALNIANTIIGSEETRTVDARELHTNLGVGKNFSAWIQDRITKYGFIENEDFIIRFPNLETKKQGGQNRKDYILTLDTAKEIAMVENNEQGRKIRKYLIQIEKEYREGRIGNPTSISSPEQMNEIITNFIKTHDMLETENYMTLMMAPFKVFWAYQKKNENLTKLLEEQHEIIQQLTVENGKLTKENHSLKNDPLSMLVTSLKIATGREVQLSLGPTTGQNIDHTHTTIKGFCAEHKIKLAHGDSIRFSNILKSLCKQAGEIIEKIPDARYGTLNIYPRYLLADAIKFL